MQAVKRRTRAALGAFIVALIVTSVAASASSAANQPASQASGGGSHLSFAFANYNNESPQFGPILKSVEKAAKLAGASLTTYDNKADPTTALTNARLMVQAHPSVIIDYSPVASIGSALDKQFARAHIPCIAVNIAIPGCSLLNIVNPTLGVAAGNLAASYSKAHGWTGANTTVLLGGDPVFGYDPNNCVRYLYFTLMRKVSGYKVIKPSQYTLTTTRIGTNVIVFDAGTAADTSFTAVQAALQTIPKSRHIILSAVNDDEASGAWRAIVQAGRANNAIVIGEGGTPATRKNLLTIPGWYGEIDAFQQTWGAYAVAMAKAVFHGAKAPALTALPYAALTRATLRQYYKGSNLSQSVKLPPPVASNRYLYKQGILQHFGA